MQSLGTPTSFLATTDADASKVFFGETLEELTLVDDSPFALVFQVGETTLRVTPVETFTPDPFTVLGWETTDVESSVRGLTNKGVSFLRYDGMEQDKLGIWSSPSGARIAWFNDPSGNVLSLAQM